MSKLRAQPNGLRGDRSTSDVPVLKAEDLGMGVLFQVLPDAILIVDRQAELLLLASPSAERLFGVSAAEAAGLPLDRFLPGQPLATFEAAQGRPVEGLARALDGRAFAAEISVVPLPALGEAYGAVVVRDIHERTASDAERRAREAQLAEAEHLAHLGSWKWDPSSNRIHWSDELYRIFGQDPGRFMPTFEGFMAQVHESHRELVRSEMEHALEDGQPFAHYARIVRTDGQVRMLHCRGKVEHAGSGRPLYVVGTAQDVTDQLRLEAALRESEARLRAIVDQALDGIWLKDLEGRHLLINAAGAAISGHTVEAALGLTDEELYDPETAETIRAIDQRVLDSGKGEVYEIVITTQPLGTRTYLSMKFPYLRENGTLKGLVVMTRDITERKEAEAELRRSYALVQAQQEASLDGILVVDEAGWVIGHNQRFLDIWGISQALGGARMDSDLLARAGEKVKNWDAFRERVHYLYRHRSEVSREEIDLLDGRCLERYSAPVLSPQGEYFGRIWSFRDITERKQLEEHMREQYERMKELDRLKTDFVNAVSHELRTPLTSIRGYLEFMEDGIGGTLSPQHAEYVQEIERSSARLARLVDDLLDFARIQAGTFELRSAGFDLADKIREVATSLVPQADKAQVTLDVSIDEPLMVWGDPQRLSQVLLNLASNAIKFTPEGGRVELRGYRSGDLLRVEVRDTGPGIAPDDLPLLFQKFSQLSEGRHKGGSGLGLSISKAIVEAHEGRIGVESMPGEGSVFWFTVPAPEEP